MLQTVQLALSDGAFSAAVRDALSRSCAWHVEPVERPESSRGCVLVLDEAAFDRLILPLANPERIVLISRGDAQELMARAWEAGIVSVVSAGDPINTVLLAIMAAALRVGISHDLGAPAAISPSAGLESAPDTPPVRPHISKRSKNQ